MNIALTGATGFIGQRVIALAGKRGHQVIGFTRHSDRPVPGCIETRRFDLQNTPDLARCDAVIHLAGENVFGLWTAEKRRKIRESRELGTRRIVEAILAATAPPRVLVSSSGIAFYGDTGERPVDENAPPASGFLAEVTKTWEAEAVRARVKSTRVVLLRTAVVLGAGGGALRMMAPVFRAGLGGKLGSGQQWMSWIHLDDIAALALFAAETEGIEGPINGTSPEPCRNSDFTRVLAEILHRPAFLSVPAFVLRAFAGEFSRELLDSKRILPTRALEIGYAFQHPQLEGALRSALGQI